MLTDLAGQLAPASPQGAEALARLKDVQAAIDEVKRTECARRVEDIAAQVADLRRRGGAGFAAVRAALVPLLEATPGRGAARAR